MMVTTLRENPELAIFLTLAIGFGIGRIRFGTFSLGNVVGTLLVPYAIGNILLTAWGPVLVAMMAAGR